MNRPRPVDPAILTRAIAWSAERVWKRLRAAARDLDVVLSEPFPQVAFLPPPVVPHRKITDMGLVDVDRFEFVRD